MTDYTTIVTPSIPGTPMFDDEGRMTDIWQRFFIDFKRVFSDPSGNLTASRIVATDSDGVKVSISDLTSWIAGTNGRITVTDDGDGTVTIDLPSLTASRLASTDGDEKLVSTILSSWITGTALQITVTDDGDGSVTLSIPAPFRVPATGDNYFAIAADGEVSLHGTARSWKAFDIEPEGVKLPGANPPAEDNIDGFSFHRFDRGTEESVHYHWEIPDDFAVGDANVRGYFKFVVENPPVGADEAVVLGFEFKKIVEGEVFSFAAGTTTGTITETIVDGETAYIVHITALGTCVTTGWARGDTVLFRFFRDATNVDDTYDNEAGPADNDVWMYNYHLEYLVDGFGSAS